MIGTAGRITVATDPETSMTSNGRLFVRFRAATYNPDRKNDPNAQDFFHNFVLFADIGSPEANLKKGDGVAFTRGVLKQDSYVNKEGQNRTSDQIEIRDAMVLKKYRRLPDGWSTRDAYIDTAGQVHWEAPQVQNPSPLHPQAQPQAQYAATAPQSYAAPAPQPVLQPTPAPQPQQTPPAPAGPLPPPVAPPMQGAAPGTPPVPPVPNIS